MEEITLWAPGEAPQINAHDAPPQSAHRDSQRVHRPDQLERRYLASLRERDRFAFTARGRRRRRERYQAAMKRLAKEVAVAVSRPVSERKERTAASIRTYAATMALIEAASRHHKVAARRARAATRNSLILAMLAVAGLSLLAAYRGWIRLT